MIGEDSKMAVKRKSSNTIVAEGLNSNATYDELIETLQSNQKKNKVYTLCCQTVRQRRTTPGRYLNNMHYLLPGHPLNRFKKEWDGMLNSGYFESLSHKSLMPKIISPVRNSDKKDPVTEFMRKKIMWQDTIRDYRRTLYVLCKKNKYDWINEEILHCPKQFVDIAAHYEQNPDPYFNSNYNWFYAGHGNMHIIEINGDDYLSYSEFSCFYLLPFTKNDLSIDYDNGTKYDCGHDNHIFETISSANIIALRMRNKIVILKILHSPAKVEIEKIKEMDSDIPFTGISFDEYHKNILYVTNLAYKLTIVNIDRMAGRSKQLRGEVSSMVDNWNRVIGTERGYYSHISKKYVTLYDKRTNSAFQRWRNLHNVTDDAACNEITVAKHGLDKRLMYVGTDHHLFLIDLRYNKEDRGKLQTVQRWTHGMEFPPTYMSLCKFEYNKELICMSSQWSEDMCVVSNYADRLTRYNDVSSVTIPYRPPSILQTLKEAREKLLCCDVNNPIDSRLCTSITGLSLIEQDDSQDILMLNSLGDISCHTLCPQHMTAFFDDDSCELLNEWSKSFKAVPKTLEVSSIIDISNIWKELKSLPPDYKLGENKLIKKADKYNEDEINEAFEKEEIEPGLQDVWEKTENEITKNESSLNLFFHDVSQ